MRKHLTASLIILGLLGAGPARAESPTVKLHVRAPGNEHIHVEGSGINSISVGKGSVVTVTAGDHGTNTQGDLAMELMPGATGSLIIVDTAPNVAWFSDYCHKTHALPAETVFSSVDTGVQLVPRIVGGVVVLTVTPFISYHAPTGSGTVLFRTASSQARGSAGQQIAVSAPSAKTRQLYRYIFGPASASDTGLLQITPEILLTP